MSKKNIVAKEKNDQGVIVTFQNDDGQRVYQYRGRSAQAIQRGKDPGDLTGGKLLKFIPKR